MTRSDSERPQVPPEHVIRAHRFGREDVPLSSVDLASLKHKSIRVADPSRSQSESPIRVVVDPGRRYEFV